MKFTETIKHLETMQGKVESRIQALKETKNNLICSELHVLYDTKSEIKATIDALCRLQEIKL